ncbi:MAG: FecR family protein, partial [Pedobacter sp.]
YIKATLLLLMFKMDNKLSEDLLQKYVAGNCTQEEQAIVESWYLSQLKNTKDRPSQAKIDVAQEEAWKIIMPPSRVSFPFYKWTGAAAAILIAILFVYKLQPTTTKTPKYETETLATTDLKSEEKVFEASKIENTMMKLPDSTIVILEKGSKLTLLPSFNGKHKREVELIGKAFFDVAHNSAKPFIIYAGNVTTKVLGTAFDITAREGSKSVKVNVIRGLVEVSNKKSKWFTHLKKDMQVVYQNDVVTNRGPVNAKLELQWRQQDIEFNDISLGDAQSRLEEKFGYKLYIQDIQLRKSTFTYSMRAKESMESFIKSICLFLDATYTIDQKSKTISIKPLNQ